MVITTTAMQLTGEIRKEYTCDGEDKSPSLTFSEVPDTAESLTLIMDDPDAPNGTFTHWLLYDMSPGTLQLIENTPPAVGKAGKNGFGKLGYGGPCPPSGTHHYHFKLFALDAMLELPEGADRQSLESAMEGHVIDQAEMVGTYARQTQA